MLYRKKEIKNMEKNKIAFLMAAGNAVRWNGISKQKICINGEMLIDRLIRQVKPFVNQIYIISWDISLNREGYIFINTKKPTDTFNHTLYLTLDKWKDINYIFATDTYYTDDFIKKVFENEKFNFYGYYTIPPKYYFPNQERSAICIPIHFKDMVENGIISCIEEWNNYQSYICQEMTGFYMVDYAKYIYRWMKKSGVKGFISWKILKPFINKSHKFIEINDRTSEFDTPKEFENWINNRPKYYDME
jgi:hypothetical protein